MNKSMEATEMPNVSNILIVDDTSANLRLLSGMLSEQNHKVRMAPNGRLALLNAQFDPPDLILLDIKMPEMSGYEVCEQLKADPRTCDIPVIFISALDETMDKVKAFTFGGVDYVTKPFQAEEVLARVKTHLALYHLQEQLAERVHELEAALEKVKKLEGLLPICSYCKRVRDDHDYWQQVEAYIEARSDALFTHGVCPECYEKYLRPQVKALKHRKEQDEN